VMADFTADWFSRAIPVWQELVLPRLTAGRRRWLELGSYEGRSALWTLDNALRYGDELVCVDYWPDAAVEARFDANVGKRAVKHKALCIDFLLHAVQQGDRFDVIYIDADHEAAACIEQAVLAWRLLGPGGILIFDDYSWTHPIGSVGKLDPRGGIDSFVRCYQTRLTVLHLHVQAIVEKRR
jgi:predicted O-methyltransferase YrrM